MKGFILIPIVILCSISCSKKSVGFTGILLPPKKCVIILVDGPRWEETGGDSTHQFMPFMYSELAPQGVLFNQYYNNGETFTLPGIVATMTGHYEMIPNDGSQLPAFPSLAMLFKEKHPESVNWIITSKDKVEILENCTQSTYEGLFAPHTDCGINGWGTGYRADTVTFVNAMNVLQNEHPDFIFISFKDPDSYGHANLWPGYLNSIKKSDEYVKLIWDFVQTDTAYAGKTLFVVTNDHGRHTNGIADGFVSHGDGCSGCRHINLFMSGPGVLKNKTVYETCEQPDVHATICKLFGLNASFTEGRFLFEAFDF